MKTRDLIIDELGRVDKIVLKVLAQRIDKKIDTTSHAVKKLSNDGMVKSERVWIGTSYNTFVWLANKKSQLESKKIQVESKELISSSNHQEKPLATEYFSDQNQKRFQVENNKTDRISENNNIQVEKPINPFGLIDSDLNLLNAKGRLKLPLEKLRGIYWDLTMDKSTGRGKTDRHSKNKIIDKIKQEIEFQRGD